MYFAQAIYPDGKPHWTIAVEFAAGVSGQNRPAMMAAWWKKRDGFSQKSDDRLNARIEPLWDNRSQKLAENSTAA